MCTYKHRCTNGGDVLTSRRFSSIRSHLLTYHGGGTAVIKCLRVMVSLVGSPEIHVIFVLLQEDSSNCSCWYSKCNVWRISSLVAVWLATAACTIHCTVQPWECSTDHCRKHWHTIETLCPTCAAVSQYFIQLPTGCTVRSYKGLKIFNKNTFLLEGVVNVGNTVYF